MTPWKRTLVVTAISQVFSILGFSFVVPFMPLFIQQLGIHGVASVTLWAALLSGGTAVTMAISSPIWGVLADRYGRKIMVVRAALSAALLVGLMGLAQNVWQLLALRVLQGGFTGTVSASQALVASQAPKERMGFSLGIMQTSVFLGTSLGPFAGGVVADTFGFRRSFIVAGLALFCSGLLVALLVQEEERFGERKGEARPQLLSGMGDALKIRGLPAMIGAVFAVQFGTTVVFPILPQFIQILQGAAGHAATVTGIVFAGAGIAGAISSVVVGWFSDRIGYRSILVVAALSAAILSVPQYFVTATWQLFVLRVGISLCMGAILPASSALVASLVPSEKRGTAYGLTASANAVGFAAGPLTAAAVVALVNIRAVFLTAAVLLGFIALWVGTVVRIPDDEDVVPSAGLEIRKQTAS